MLIHIIGGKSRVHENCSLAPTAATHSPHRMLRQIENDGVEGCGLLAQGPELGFQLGGGDGDVEVSKRFFRRVVGDFIGCPGRLAAGGYDGLRGRVL